jgi:hypothetical protein
MLGLQMMIQQWSNIINYSKLFGINNPSIMDNVEGEYK